VTRLSRVPLFLSPVQRVSSASEAIDRDTTASPVGIGRTVVFWLLSVLGTAGLAFALLLTQTPGKDRSFDVIILLGAGTLLTLALAVARFRLLPAIFLGAELLACLYALISILTYRR
jgi:hypothetical protein